MMKDNVRTDVPIKSLSRAEFQYRYHRYFSALRLTTGRRDISMSYVELVDSYGRLARAARGFAAKLGKASINDVADNDGRLDRLEKVLRGVLKDLETGRVAASV